MKTKLATWIVFAAVSILLACRPVQAQVPPVTFTAEPKEDGNLVYLPLPPETGTDSPSHLFGLRLSIKNNDTNDLVMTLIRLTFTYPDTTVTNIIIGRGVTIAAGKSRTDTLSEKDPQEAVRLADPAPTQVRIELYFEGYRNPAALIHNLSPYQAPTSSGSYLFPGNAADLSDDQYWSYSGVHAGGSQFFGHDLKIYGWNADTASFSTRRPGTDGTMNEHSLGWGIPVYAMADGVVLRAFSDWEDNPAPDTRVIQRMAHDTGEAVTALQVTRLDDDRVATVVRDSSANVKIIVWDIGADGNQITRRGSVVGEPAQQLTTDALDSSTIVTATRSVLGVMRLGVWDISSDGMSVSQATHLDVEPIQELSLAKISGSTFATAVTMDDGLLHLTVWASGSIISASAEDFGETASSLSLTALSATRLALAIRNAEGRLQVIVWDLVDNGGTLSLQRLGQGTAVAISKVIAVDTSDGDGMRLVTAMRTAAGNLKVMRWNISEDGQSVAPDFEVNGEPIQDLAAARTANGDEPDTITTAVITESGNLKNFLWTTRGVVEPKSTALELWGQREDGTASTPGIEEYNFNSSGVGRGRLVCAIRNASGNLQVITLRVGGGGGNGFRILHGNCRMIYAHFQAGTVNPEVAYPGAHVKAGQYLGSMGNTGQSTGPHTHIHAERVDESYSVAEMIAAEAVDLTDHILTYRPIPFRCASAMRLDAIEPGGLANTDNTFSALEGQGVYFEDFGILPQWQDKVYVDGSSECSFPIGTLNCVGNFLGPYHTVNAGLNKPCWGYQLFIRAGTYNESVLFNRGMTVRSYDGAAIIGAP